MNDYEMNEMSMKIHVYIFHWHQGSTQYGCHVQLG